MPQPWLDTAPSATIDQYGLKGTGTVDDSAALQALVIAGTGHTVNIPQGSYLVTAATIAVPANTRIVTHNATFIAGANLATGIFSYATSDVTISGRFTYDANGKSTPFMVGTTGGDNFFAWVRATIKGANTTPSANNYLFKQTLCNRSKIGGWITTPGNSPWFVYQDRCTWADISGIVTPPITVDDGVFAPVFCTDTTSTNGMQHLNVHDIYVDGGNILAQYAPVFIGTIGTTLAGSHITVSNVQVKNTAGTADGVDIICCAYASVTNCTFEAVMYGVGIAGGSVISVSNIISYNNRGVNVGVGDVSTPMDTTLVLVSNCNAYACGQGIVPYAYLVSTGNNKNTAVVRFNNCFAYGTPGAYAFATAKNGSGTVSDLEINGGELLTGSTAVFNDTAGTATVKSFRARNVKGYNPVGVIASPPAIGATGVAITNTTGVDCMVIFYTNGASTITNMAIGGTALAIACGINAQTVPFMVPAGQTFTPSYTGAPTMAMIGM